MDPVLIENTRAWLVKSIQDLHRAKRLTAETVVDHEDALFHSQQAVEKAMKAFLTWHDRPFRKTHDLDALGDECALIDPSLAGPFKEAAALTEFRMGVSVPWRFDHTPRSRGSGVRRSGRPISARNSFTSAGRNASVRRSLIAAYPVRTVW